MAQDLYFAATRPLDQFLPPEPQPDLAHVDPASWFVCRLTPTSSGVQAVVCGQVVGEFRSVPEALAELERCCRLVRERL